MLGAGGNAPGAAERSAVSLLALRWAGEQQVRSEQLAIANTQIVPHGIECSAFLFSDSTNTSEEQCTALTAKRGDGVGCAHYVAHCPHSILARGRCPKPLKS
jgi:hypothetical protein